MRRLTWLCVVISACGVNEAKISENPPDLGAEGSELSAAIALQPLAEHEHAAAILDSQTKYAAYEFFGHAGDVVSIFVDDEKLNTKGGNVDGLDTVVSLYKVSFLSGRPYGAAIASNDDTADTGWTQNPYASSIDSFVLPQDRNYAIVVSTYHHAAGTASVLWMQDRVLGSLTWPGTGAGTSIQLHPQAATLLPMSAALNDAMTHFAYGPGHTEAARLKLSPMALSAALTDPAAAQLFAYEMLYDNRGQNAELPSQATIAPITRANAVNALETAVPLSDLGADEPFVDQMIRATLAAMLADGKFATSSAKVFRVHFDNSDDMSSDGIMAADLSSGEVRLLGLYSDP